MGENLESIHVHQDSQEGLLREFQEHEMFSSIPEKCPNMETVFPLSIQWPRKLVQRLKDVELDSNACEQIIMNIPLYCTGIRQLSCIELNVSYLERSNIWEKVGNTLEILKMKVEGRVGDEIRKIQKHCRKLKVIDIEDEEQTGQGDFQF